MQEIIYPDQRRSARELLWICDGCGAAEWSLRKPAHECSAKRDAWGKRTMTALRAATALETAIGVRALRLSA